MALHPVSRCAVLFRHKTCTVPCEADGWPPSECRRNKWNDNKIPRKFYNFLPRGILKCYIVAALLIEDMGWNQFVDQPEI